MAFFSEQLNPLLALSYRRPMRIRELMVFPDMRPMDSYYVCPRCQITLEREFVKYCDRCGQCLDWTTYQQAKIVYPGRKKRGDGAKRSAPAGKSLIRRILSFAR